MTVIPATVADPGSVRVVVEHKTVLACGIAMRRAITKGAVLSLTRFFAFSDSNTSPRVTIAVWGHVVASQTCMVQVPYATVTGEYVRALI